MSSASGIAAGLLREYTNATFIGSETLGYAGISNGVRQLSIKGDHTDIAIYLPLLHAEYTVNPLMVKRGVVPDYQVLPSINDILTNHDSVLQITQEQLILKNRKSIKR